MTLVLASGLLVATGVCLIASGLAPDHRQLDRLVAHLHRTPLPTTNRQWWGGFRKRLSEPDSTAVLISGCHHGRRCGGLPFVVLQ